jgi:hypothetical protein
MLTPDHSRRSVAGPERPSGRVVDLAGRDDVVVPADIELFLVAERTAMPVADDAEALSAAPGYRVISADLAVGLIPL